MVSTVPSSTSFFEARLSINSTFTKMAEEKGNGCFKGMLQVIITGVYIESQSSLMLARLFRHVNTTSSFACRSVFFIYVTYLDLFKSALGNTVCLQFARSMQDPSFAVLF